MKTLALFASFPRTLGPWSDHVLGALWPSWPLKSPVLRWANEGAKDSQEVAPVSGLHLPVCPSRHHRESGRGGRFQPKAGLGTEASDIQVTWGPSLSHAAKAGPGEGHGEAGTPRPPMPFPERVAWWPL